MGELLMKFISWSKLIIMLLLFLSYVLIIFNSFLNQIICYTNFKSHQFSWISIKIIMSAAKKEPESLIQQILKAIFPLVYESSSTDPQLTNQIYASLVNDYLKDAKEDCILDDEADRKQIRGRLPKNIAQKKGEQIGSFVKFMNEYGCCLLISKQREQSPIDLQIVIPEQWGASSSSYHKLRLQSCQPNSQSTIFLRQIQEYDMTLSEFTDLFEKNIKIQLSNNAFGANKTMKLTEQFQTVVKTAVNKIQCRNKAKQVSEELQKININTFEQVQLGANTTWYNIELIVRKVVITRRGPTQSRVLSDKLIIGYKLWILRQAIDEMIDNPPQEDDQARKNIILYKECLNQAIYAYKSKVRTHDNSNQKFYELIKQINSKLFQLNEGQFTSLITEDQEEEIIVEFTSNSKVTKPKKLQIKKLNAASPKIVPYKYTVLKKFGFEELINLYQQTQKQFIGAAKLQSAMNHWVLLVEKYLFELAIQIAEQDRYYPVIDLNIHMRQIQCEIGLSNLCKLAIYYEQVVMKDLVHYGLGLKAQAFSHIELVKMICTVVAFESVKLNREKRSSNLSAYRPPIDIERLFKFFISHDYLGRKAMSSLKKYSEKRQRLKPLFLLNSSNDTFFDFAKAVATESRSANSWLFYMKLLAPQNNKNINTFSYLLPNSEDEKLVTAFLHNLPTDIIGLLKISLYAQNPKKYLPQQQIKSNDFVAYSLVPAFDKEILRLDIFRGAKNKFVKILLNKCDKGTTYEQSQFEFYDNFYKDNGKDTTSDKQKNVLKKLEKFIRPPSDKNLRREHQAYAEKLKIMVQQSLKYDIQQLVACCTVRAAQETQILTLYSNIIKKKISVNCYEEGNKFKQEIFLQVAGLLSGTKHKTEQYFNTIKNLLDTCISNWVYSDVNFCPIFAPFISYLSKQYIEMKGLMGSQARKYKKLSYLMAEKCLNQFKKAQEDTKKNPELNNEWYQRFVMMSLILCFRQVQLSLQQGEQIKLLTKGIFYYRITCLMSNQTALEKDKRKFHVQRAYALQKTIFNNIEVLSHYFAANEKELKQIVEIIDEGFPSKDISLQRKNIYEFHGISSKTKDSYQIDLSCGHICKNGKELSALDEKIRTAPNYKLVFGQRDFQVYLCYDSTYLRTKNDFAHIFHVDMTKYQIFFEFSVDGATFRYVVKNKKTSLEQYWEYVPLNIIESSDCQLPKIFTAQYLVWYCESKNCMMFRNKNYQQIYDIGLLLHLQNSKEIEVEIKKAVYIVFHSKNHIQDLDKICDYNNLEFEELILRSKENELSQFKPFQILQKLDKNHFIFELRNQRSKQVFYLAHRYQLRFKLDKNKNQLTSESHFGYRVDTGYVNTENNIYEDGVTCLVLRKDETNLMVLNNHKRIIIVSDGEVRSGGALKRSKDPKAKIKSYKYEIHDFFGDLRGSTRESQLHLAAIFLTLEDNMRIAGVQLTPLQYSIHLLRTCFTNRPLNTEQQAKLLQIVNLANDKPIESGQMLLLCEALHKGSTNLKQILPFNVKNDSSKIDSKIKQLQGKFLFQRTLYEKQINNHSIAYRKRIEVNMLKYIGVNVKQSDYTPDQPNQEQIRDLWPGIKEQDKNQIQEKYPQIQKQYKELCKGSKSLQGEPQNVNQPIVQFSQNIVNNNQKFKPSAMMKQLVKQLKSSHQQFAKQQNSYKGLKQKFGKDQLKKEIDRLINKYGQCIKKIDQMLETIKKSVQEHPDIISGYRPYLSYTFFTRILCFENEIYNYFPSIGNKNAGHLKQSIKMWMDLQTRKASLERVKLLIKQSNIDVVALLRQLKSPRQEIYKNTEWICFESEMKIQIWPSQLQTYNNLMKDTKKGNFCQLNMGEGKTQVIIPMIILNTIFKQKEKLPRVNLLSSLYEQARSNMFKFLSVTGFQLIGFEIPFNRTVGLSKNSIYSIRNIMNSFSNRGYILVNREWRLSQILRYNEIHLSYEERKQNKKLPPIFTLKVLDIFDEVDAMMTPKKSYIFSIGSQQQLPSAQIRLEVMRQLIQVFLTKCMKWLYKEKIVTSDQTQEGTYKIIQTGQFPDGLRLLFDKIPAQKADEWRSLMAKQMLKAKQSHYFSFVQKLDDKQFNALVRYCVDSKVDITSLNKKISVGSYDQIYALRGALAFGIFQHCLSKRCGVDYGIPSIEHKKKIAVPYDAADIPSKTSEYEHPQVSSLYSYIAYYTRGLTKIQFQNCLLKLEALTPNSKQNEYSSWISILNEDQKRQLVINNAKKININSKSDIAQLYQTFKKNRNTVSFWLNHCIFPKDLKQYPHNICSSSFDLADVDESIGFSGTMDNRWVLPNKLTYSPSPNPNIKGTDGQMINLVTTCTTDIQLIKEDNTKSLWQRFVNQALEKKVGCILDAGALCVGKSLRQEIVPYISDHPSYNIQKFPGISFCDENGQWLVYDIESKTYINRGTTIPDHQTFVLFDEARTRGADIKMSADISAGLSLGPELTKDKLMQAAGRLRKLGRKQTLIIFGTHEVFSTLPGFPKQIADIDKKFQQMKTKKLQFIQLIISWSCINAIEDNESMLTQFSSLGWKYVYSKAKKTTFKQEIKTKLEDKYRHVALFKTVSEIGKEEYGKKEKEERDHETAKHINTTLQKYGAGVYKNSKSMEDICQRQIEVEVQVHIKVQTQKPLDLIPIPQKELDIKQIAQVLFTEFTFKNRFFMTDNFIKTTMSKNGQQKKQFHELPQAYFIKFNQEKLVMVSLREASIFIKQHILATKIDKDNFKLGLLSDVTLQNPDITKLKLEEALITAKFVAGYEQYNADQQKILTKVLSGILKKSGSKKDYEEKVSTILKMRRLYSKKFLGSDLQKVVIRLINEN